MDANLIIDVGLYDGRDTAYYLHRGYKVVAIDAHARWIREAERRFPEAIAEGRLRLLNVGIAFERKRARLYYADVLPAGASLKDAKASRHGEITDSFEVECVPFTDVLRDHGVPYYLKVDIEGLDRACLTALSVSELPAYVSWEEGEDVLQNLSHLRSIGFEHFKAINQITFRELSRERSLMNRAKGRLRRSLGLTGKPCRTRDGWEFTAGCSGPFGAETDGRWRSYDEITRQWRAFCLEFPRADRGGWHDFHARSRAAC